MHMCMNSVYRRIVFLYKVASPTTGLAWILKHWLSTFWVTIFYWEEYLT